MCPLSHSHVQRADGELEEAIESVGSGQQDLISVFQDPEADEPELIAEGFERHVAMEVEVGGKPQHWSERRLVVRSVAHGKAAEAALQARIISLFEDEDRDIRI